MPRGVVTEQAIGVVDGVNDAFQTTAVYDPDVFQVMLQGTMRIIVDADGWIITGPQSFRLKKIPRIDDKVMVIYYRTV